jgi:hypothetical protein
LYRAPEGSDLIDIEESTKIWIDHNDFSSVGVTGDKDKYDGLLDAKRGSDMLTFSWNKFHDHVSLHGFSVKEIHLLTWTYPVEGLIDRPQRLKWFARQGQAPSHLPP